MSKKSIYPHTRTNRGKNAPAKPGGSFGVGIYLDYAASTPLDPRVLKAMLPYLQLTTHNSQPTNGWGNPGSLHSFGQRASAAVFAARQVIAKELNANYHEVIFTGSATEANNLALRGAVAAWIEAISNKPQVTGKKVEFPIATSHLRLVPRIVISAIEHESVLATAKDLEKEGVEVVVIPVTKDGKIDLKKLKAALNESTVLVSVMYANNEVGTIQPIREIKQLIANYKLQTGSLMYPLFHTDAVQALQYIECDMQRLGVDLLTISAHKIYGPKGIGALYVRRAPASKLSTTDYRLRAIITGGGQENGLRSGTENVPAIVGFAKAVELVAANREKEALRVAKLRDELWRGIKKIFPSAVLNGPVPTTDFLRLPNNLNFYLPKISGEQMLVALDLQGIAVSSGSACSARSIDPSHVLLAMGFDKARAKNSIRISLGRMTTRAEFEEFLKTLRGISENSSKV